MLSGFAARGLAPLHQRESSRKRSRRTRLFLAVAVMGYLAMGLARLVDDDLEPRWMFVVAMAGVVAVIVGVLGAGWAAVWRYGDEEPDPT